MSALYTIGYGHRTFEEFLAVLRRYAIAYVVDVRSKPYSRYRPEYAKEPLEAQLKRERLKYLFMGDVLGGLPDDPSVYTDGHVDYAKIRETPWFASGLARLQKAHAQRLQVALMCGEAKPEGCHRTKLLGATLTELAIPVLHIDEHDELLTQQAAIQKVTGGQLSLFGEIPELTVSRKRYRDD